MKKDLSEIANVLIVNSFDKIPPESILISSVFVNRDYLIFYTEKSSVILTCSCYYLLSSTILSQEELFYIINTNDFKEWYKNCADKNKKINIEKLMNFKIEIPSIQVIQDSILDKVYFLDNLKRDEIPNLYKCMPLSRFTSSVKEKKLVFVSPETWLDPFETKFFSAEYPSYNFKKPDVYCMCLTNKAAENEEAAWKMYSDGSNSKTVKITFSTEKLLTYLNAYATLLNCKVYIGKAIYDYSTTEINNLHKKNHKGHVYFFPQAFELKHYLSLLCIKRKAFTFENEIRIFLVFDANNKKDKFMSVENIDYNSGLIKEVRLSPYPPFSFSDPRKEIYKKIQKLESDAIKLELTDLLNNVKVTQCNLYVKDGRKKLEF